MKILILSNIPSPYRIDFFNELGKHFDLTVVFEAKDAEGITFNWNLDKISNFKAIFLKEGNIEEKRIDFSILKFIKKGLYDEVIITSYGYYTEMLALIVLKFKRIPYYLEVDGGLIRTESKLKKLFKKFLISGAKGYFSPSKSSDKYLVYYGANVKRIYRYPFTSLRDSDIEIVSQQEKNQIRDKLLIKEQHVVLSVGRFIYSKGFDVLLRACKEINTNVGIYIVGGIATDEYLDIQRSHNLSNVHFVKFKTKTELEEYYKAADIFVLPTREDVWGLVINEAMAKGLPIVTTEKCVAGLELVRENVNGYIIPVDNEELISLYINRLIKDDNLRGKLSENSVRIIKKYKIKSMIDEHIKILKKS